MNRCENSYHIIFLFLSKLNLISIDYWETERYSPNDCIIFCTEKLFYKIQILFEMNCWTKNQLMFAFFKYNYSLITKPNEQILTILTIFPKILIWIKRTNKKINWKMRDPFNFDSFIYFYSFSIVLYSSEKW